MKKISFNDEYGLTDAVLSGRKTMKRMPIPCSVCQDVLTPIHYGGIDVSHNYMAMQHAHYKIGDIVAVAQSYSQLSNGGLNGLATEAGWNDKSKVKAKLMPHQVRITDVWIERLQDIKENDCLKEGIFLDETASKCYQPFYTFPNFMKENAPAGCHNPKHAFELLIRKIGGKQMWKTNLWVFVYTFELIK